ncbi:MAG: class I SAM-dependent methyltransferase, partial [Ramlibacter sp.]|nr:class I SAM-dependent methyltransferase [Ramlibacter sp.]
MAGSADTIRGAAPITCPVCGGACPLLDVLDFHQSAVVEKTKPLPLSGEPIYYALCESCGFCFAPGICSWTKEQFEQKIYNEQYSLVDPHHIDHRPRGNAAMVLQMFGLPSPAIRHLDYGGGNGVLSRVLAEAGWQSTSYDPFVDRDLQPQTLGQFD